MIAAWVSPGSGPGGGAGTPGPVENRATMSLRTTAIRLTAAWMALAGVSCIDINLPTGDSLLAKPSFIMSGVMDVDQFLAFTVVAKLSR